MFMKDGTLLLKVAGALEFVKTRARVMNDFFFQTHRGNKDVSY
jgi:hypothetical protein